MEKGFLSKAYEKSGLVAGFALGLSELLIGKWPTVCVVTIAYIIIGVIALGCLLIVKKEFNETAT